MVDDFGIVIAVTACFGLLLFMILYPICKYETWQEKAEAKIQEEMTKEKVKLIHSCKEVGVSANEEQLMELSIDELRFLFDTAAKKKEKARKEELMKLL